MFCIILILCFFVLNLVSVYYLEVPDFGMYVFLFLIWNVTAQVCESFHVVNYNFASYWFCSFKSHDFGFLMWDFHTESLYCLV
jgi:hypothetical protein